MRIIILDWHEYNKFEYPIQIVNTNTRMMKAGNSKGELAKKANLLGQKIITDAAITHNNCQHRIDVLQGELESAKQ